MRRLGAGAVLAAALAASGAAAQSWQPLGMSEPFPPTGTRICAEGGGQRVCLALFCPGPGTGLRIGWIDTTRPAMADMAELNLSVDNPLAAGDPLAPDARLTRLPRYPYFVAVGTLNPDRAARILAEMRSGSEVTVEEAGNGLNLPLRGSAREIARALEICGAPATDPVWADSVGTPTPAVPPAPADVPTTAPPVAPTAGAAARSAPLSSADPPAIAAAWGPVAANPVEEATGTELCFGDALDPTPVRCLRVGCFGADTPAILWWHDERVPATGGEAALVLTSRAVQAEARLSFVPSPDAPHRIGTAPLSGAVIAALGADGPLTLTLAGGGWRVEASGAGPELARVAAVCAMPETPAPAAAAAPLEPEAPRGLMRVDLPEVDLDALDAPAAAAFAATRGETVAEYERLTGAPVQSPGVALFLLGEGRQLLFTRLCGGAGFFGARGCVIDVFANNGRGWAEVFFVSGTEDSFDLDLDRMTDGWPKIVVSGGAARWGWTGAGYEIR